MSEPEQGKENPTDKIPDDKGSTAGGDQKTADKKNLLSDDELEKRIQSETDRRLTGALQTAQEKWEATATAKREEEEKAREQQRLAEEGEFKKLSEDRLAELDTLKAEKAAIEFRGDATKALTKMGMPEFIEPLLNPRKSVKEVEVAAAQLSELVDKMGAAEVAKRLDTGERPVGSGEDDPAKRPDQMTDEEWVAYKKAKGIY